MFRPLRQLFLNHLSRQLMIPLITLGLLTPMDASNPHTSLIENGDFQYWTNEGPKAWTPGKGNYRRDETMSYSGRSSVKMTHPEGEKAPAAMLSQDIRLQPDREYEIRLAIATEGAGSVAVRVQPIINGKPIPKQDLLLNWSSVWSWSTPWTPITLKFRTSAHPQYRIAIASYGQSGESAWLDGVSISQISATEAKSEGAVSLYTRSTLLPWAPEAPFMETERIGDMNLSATPGDYEAAFLGLKAQRDLSEVDVQLEGDLHNSEGQSIAADAVVIRMLWDQALLLKSKPRAAEAGHQLAWWVTVRIPDAAKAGIYKGNLLVKERGEVVSTIPYSVQVEPFRLPSVDIPAFVYHAEAYFPPGDFLSEEKRLAYYRDMKEHGMNTVTIYNTPDVNGREVDFDRDYRFSALVQEKLDQLKSRSGQSAAEWESRQTFGINQVMDLSIRSGLVTREFPVLWLPIKVSGYGFGAMPSETLKKSYAYWKSREDWPEFLLYVLDEPNGQPERIAMAKDVLQRINGLDLPMKTGTANVPVEELGKDYDVWIQIENRVSAEMAQAAKEHSAELWTYNCNMPTENAIFTRAFFGLWAYRAGVKGIGLWAYYDANTWYIDENDVIHGRNGPGRLSRICPSPSGPVPTISWETTRDGINDYRHAMLFDQLLKQARERIAAQGDGAALDLSIALRLAEDARKKIIQSIPVDAMALMGELPWTVANREFVPVIGFGDPYAVVEHKRKSLRAYIRLLHTSLRVE